MPEKLAHLRTLMIDAVPDCLVRGHEPLVNCLQLRDPDDRHVLAAAIKPGAQVIVTADKDFNASDGLSPAYATFLDWPPVTCADATRIVTASAGLRCLPGAETQSKCDLRYV